MDHIAHLLSVCSLSHRPVVDVGAGDGVYATQLDAAGAVVTAVEIHENKVANAKSRLPPSIDVRLGVAEALPLEGKSQELACFFFSFHHVPAEAQGGALDEVHRVVKSGGRLHVVEPFPFGTMFDVLKLVEDETTVRTNSHSLLNRMDQDQRFGLLDRTDYTLTREYPSFESFVDKIVLSDPNRSAIFDGVASEMYETFERVIDEVDGARVLHQPCAAYHFEVFG